VPLVRAVAIRDPEKAKRIARSLRRLVDRYREDLKPGEFWTPGSWHPGPRYVNLYLVVLTPGSGSPDPAALARRAARLLEERNNLLLDWVAGFRASGAVWLLIKPWAREARTMKRIRYRPSPDDLAALRTLLRGAGRARARVRERGG
jgi:hypothetical protein